jgi:4-alpha-glucanotransferase
MKGMLLNTLRIRNPGITPDRAAVLLAVLEFLADCPAFAFMINMEDLWQETTPQNVPGTRSDLNWNHKTELSIEEFSNNPEISDILNKVDRLRRKKE